VQALFTHKGGMTRLDIMPKSLGVIMAVVENPDCTVG